VREVSYLVVCSRGGGLGLSSQALELGTYLRGSEVQLARLEWKGAKVPQRCRQVYRDRHLRHIQALTVTVDKARGWKSSDGLPIESWVVQMAYSKQTSLLRLWERCIRAKDSATWMRKSLIPR